MKKIRIVKKRQKRVIFAIFRIFLNQFSRLNFENNSQQQNSIIEDRKKLRKCKQNKRRDENESEKRRKHKHQGKC